MSVETVKFVFYTDVHLQDKNPPSRLGNYKEDILEKVQQVMDISKEKKCDFTVCGGDLFNLKRPASTQHSLVARIIEVLDSSGIPNYCVVGNHDIQADNIETLPDQPLGVLFGGKHMLRMHEKNIFQKGDLKVLLDSYDFDEEPDWGELSHNRGGGEADVCILGAHVYASLKGGDLFGTKIFSYKELSVTEHDLYLLGHYHPDQGVEDKSYHKERQTFMAPGSLSRGDYGDENLARKPKCCLVTITKDGEDITWDVEEILLKVKPVDEVFDLERKEKLIKQKEETANFVAELEAASQKDDVAETEEEELARLTDDKRIFSRTMGYINDARDLLGKTKAKE